MGSAIGAIASIAQYKSQSKSLKKTEQKALEAEKKAEALKPAEAKLPEDITKAENRKRKAGVQSTYTAKPSSIFTPVGA